jgi:hypothetical protein
MLQKQQQIPPGPCGELSLKHTMRITGYRVFFPNNLIPPEDFLTVEDAWKRRNDFICQTGMEPYVHVLREGGPEFPIF